MRGRFDIMEQVIDCDRLKEEVRDDSCGGFTSFEGWVRDHHEGRSVKALAYSAYEGMALKEGQKVIEEALEKFEVEQLVCEHRLGKLKIGEVAVCVAVSAAHREAAFEACRYVIDEVKARVPIWKEEFYADGSKDWVGCSCGQKADQA